MNAVTAKTDPEVQAQLRAASTTTFWVVLREQADLSGAKAVKAKPEKGAKVYTSKTEQATKTQVGLRALLDRRKATYTPYWISNRIRVTGDAALLAEVAKRPEVATVQPDRTAPLPAPVQGTAQTTINGVEWNLDRIGAERAWNELGVHGEGITVANIDTGVQFDHPALAAAYRGRHADGTIDNNYNWFDPTGLCPSATPCDNNSHGTHTMGTMVGRESNGANQIGVAPGARWIAAKGCSTSSCTEADLLAAGQWILAPTDSAGHNPRPDLAPDVVNNSWGSTLHGDWYTSIVDAWVAAGIFPAFAAGNAGPDCGTAGSPGDYAASYSSAAIDVDNSIAPFSSRGGGENSGAKPNIAAPGVDVRSSVPGGYATYSGTSMASPHTAGAVALLWSQSPTLIGDIAATRALLDKTATDAEDLSCGGTAADNRVYGQGRLNIEAALRAAPRGTGMLLGYAYDTATTTAVGDLSVSIVGPQKRVISTTGDGNLRLDRVIPGSYTYTATKFGYATLQGAFTIAANQPVTLTLRLQPLPKATITGVVHTGSGRAEPAATVAVIGTPVSTVTGADGAYRLVVPFGTYELRAESPGNRCAAPQSVSVTVTSDAVVDVALPNRQDTFGHSCRAPVDGYAVGTDLLALTGDDVTAQVDLASPVRLYGQSYSTAWVSTNGVVSLSGPHNGYANEPVPGSASPRAALVPFWDDLFMDDQSAVYTSSTGGQLVVEWRNVTFFGNRMARTSFSATVAADGTVTFGYRPAGSDDVSTGIGATIGLVNADATDGFQYSANQSVVSAGFGVTFAPPAGGA